MPIDSVLLSIAVSGVFLAFAVVLAWTDHRTSTWQRGEDSKNHTATEPARKQAA